MGCGRNTCGCSCQATIVNTSPPREPLPTPTPPTPTPPTPTPPTPTPPTPTPPTPTPPTNKRAVIERWMLGDVPQCNVTSSMFDKCECVKDFATVYNEGEDISAWYDANIYEDITDWLKDCEGNP